MGTLSGFQGDSRIMRSFGGFFCLFLHNSPLLLVRVNSLVFLIGIPKLQAADIVNVSLDIDNESQRIA
jgi:hypothetical protein